MSTSTDTDLFERAVRHLLQVEGGYSNDPMDRGGETRFGISKRAYPELDISRLTVDDAIALYRRDYWQRYQCDQFPPELGVFLFDGIVNHGPKTAVRLLQMALRVTADGHVGPQTLGEARSAAANTGYPTLVALAFAHRADYYHDIITADSSQARFALGWFKRLFLLLQFIVREL